MSTRPSLILGMRTGELKSPHSPHIPLSFIRRIEKISKARQAHEFATTRGVLESDILVHFSNEGVQELEIFGVWEELCVKSTISYALRFMFLVHVPKKYTMRHPLHQDGTLATDITDWIVKESRREQTNYFTGVLEQRGALKTSEIYFTYEESSSEWLFQPVIRHSAQRARNNYFMAQTTS